MYTDTHRCYTGTRLDQCTDYRISYYVMFTYHCYTCMLCLHITVTYACHVSIALLPMHVWFLYSCHMIPRSYYMYYYSMFPYSCYMIDSCDWYGYSRYWTWELLICDMWNPTSIVILFPLYCSCYIVPVSRYIVLCYQQNSGLVIRLPVSCTVICILLHWRLNISNQLGYGGDLMVD